MCYIVKKILTIQMPMWCFKIHFKTYIWIKGVNQLRGSQFKLAVRVDSWQVAFAASSENLRISSLHLITSFDVLENNRKAISEAKETSSHSTSDEINVSITYRIPMSIKWKLFTWNETNVFKKYCSL